MDPQTAYSLIRSVGEECINEDELQRLITGKPNFRLYDGFEPSGRMHIAQGVFKAVNVNKCTSAGGVFIFWVADWFALMNDKMGGDLKMIQTVGEYLIEVWKAAGMDMEKVQFLWSSEEINKHAKDYWMQALDIARKFTIARVTKCCQIMGRKENTLSAAQILYPIMQCTDIFFLKTDICQLGVDQRKVNMLARDYCEAIGRKLKPVILSHHMLYGLKKGQQKMSKSDPDSAIFMEDTAEDVRRKILQAYCPAKAEGALDAITEEESMQLEKDDLMNPCLDYIKYIIFSKPGSTIQAGGITFQTFAEVKESFTSGKISETDLKEALIEALNALLQPVRDHFKNDEKARSLLETIQQYKKDAQPAQPSATTTSTSSSTGKKPTTVIFSGLPTFQFSLVTVFDTLQQFKAIPADHEAIFYIRDWTAFVSNAVGGDEAAIKAAFTVFCEAMVALDPKTMEKVKIVWQSESILSNPNDYWITVINAGRKFTLDKLRSLADKSNEQPVSDVIAPLMHLADMVHNPSTTVRGTPDQDRFHAFGNEYLTMLGMPNAEILLTSPTLPLLKQNGDWLDVECHINVLDNEMEVNNKMKKKAFCEPGNVAFCPPIALAKDVILPVLGQFELQRKDSDGGNKIFTTVEELTTDFANGSIHPNDLKPNTARLLNEVLARVRDRFKTNAMAKKAAADLANFEKKFSKKKGK